MNDRTYKLDLKFETIWQVKKGVGSFVTFDMGKKLKRTTKNDKEVVSGSIHLWIYMCEWQYFKSQTNFVVTSDSIQDELELGALEGQTISEFRVQGTRVTISFSNGDRLELSEDPEADPNDELFILYLPDRTISFSKAGSLQTEVEGT